MAVSLPAAGRLEVPQVVAAASGEPLQRWLLAGPFQAEAGEDGLDVDFLADLGLTEAESSDPERWGPMIAEQAETGRLSMVEGSDLMVFNIFFPRIRSRTSLHTVVYAVCQVTSDAGGEAWLLLGTDNPTRVWLNGGECHRWRERRPKTIYDDAVRLNLRPGSNLLLIKIEKIKRKWEMMARLEPDAEAAGRTLLSIKDGFLKRRLIPEGGGLELIDRSLPAFGPFEGRVEALDGTSIRSVEVGGDKSAGLAGIPPGLYRVGLAVDGRRYWQPFCLGGTAALRTQLAERCAEAEVDDRTAINLQALLRRLEILDRPYKTVEGEADWKRQDFLEENAYKTIYAATALGEALAHINRGEEPFAHVPGLHIRGFRSRIDDQVMHYRLLVPARYNRDASPLPLVIVFETVAAAKRPYLESVHVANQNNAEKWAGAGERLGVGILWVGHRTQPYGNPIDYAHFDEVLAQVEQDYVLDRSRLYLYGVCSAGVMAMGEAIRHPDRYAAITFVNPVLHRVKNRYDDDGRFRRVPVYREWLLETDPVVPLATLRHPPVAIVHDGGDPDHGPLSHSVDFVEMSRAVGNRTHFQRNTVLPPSRFTLYERQIDWLSEHRRGKAQPLTVSPIGSGGPLSRVFAERFIVVEATGGSEDERRANREISAAFQVAWRRMNHVPCRVVTDAELPDGEEEQSHLVLIGNERTNAVWQRLASRFPVTLTEEEITIAARTWSGAGLGLQTWFPHPDHPGKRIVLIGGHIPDVAVFGTMELALDGWFDFAIWQTRDGSPRLLAAERFEKAP